MRLPTPVCATAIGKFMCFSGAKDAQSISKHVHRLYREQGLQLRNKSRGVKSKLGMIAH
jgi:hypothetical protein